MDSSTETTTTGIQPSQSRSNAEVSAWQSRIRSIQIEKGVTPEELGKIREKADMRARATRAVKSAERIERCNYISSENYRQCLNEYNDESMAMASAPERQAARKETINKFSSRSTNIKKTLGTMTSSIQSAVSRRAVPVPSTVFDSSRLGLLSDKQEEDDDEVAEEGLGTLERELGVHDVLQVQMQTSRAPQLEMMNVQQTVSSQIDDLLRQMVVEPTDPDDLAAKFTLFEQFLDTVSSIRDLTLEYWTQNEGQFEGSVKQACQREIARIDRDDNLGIIDDPRKWFVYSMTKKANENSRDISKVLSGLKAKFSLISQDLYECPFCLDNMTEGNNVLLGCCHRTCNDCWDNWVSLKGHQAFCPLCMHVEFVEEITTGM